MIPDVLNNPIPKQYRKLSGSFLKVVAVVTMVIDHIGAGIVLPLLITGNHFFMPDWNAGAQFYYWLRYIGRTAFPVYCFLLVEGYFHSGHRGKYFLSLVLFAFLSELPFDLALIAESPVSNTFDIAGILTTDHDLIVNKQNVYFTLALGIAMIFLSERAFAFASLWSDSYAKKHGVGKGYYAVFAYLVAFAVSFLSFVAAYLAADILHTDYSHDGIILIALLYLLRRVRLIAAAAGYLYFWNYVNLEVWSLPAFLMMLFYNEERGFIKGGWKYLFYLVYPVHLILIYAVRVLIL